MKKLISLILAAVMVMSLAACGSKTDNGDSGDQAYTPASALDLLEKVWAAFPEDNKFPPAAATTPRRTTRRTPPASMT